MSTIRLGDIYWYDFGAPVDERQAGLRPALIVQTDFLNQIEHYGLTIVVPMTTKGRPSHIRIEPSSTNGLSATTFIKSEQVYTISKQSLGSRIGSLDADVLPKVKAMLREVFSIGS